MHFSENEGIEGKKFVVTGGLGFVGSALCLELARRGADEVRSLDPRPSSPWSIELKKAGVQLIRGDVCEKKDVKKALSGANCVFHLASYGMSGKEMLQAGRVDQVNINGTCNILDACHEAGIKRLVYVSTYNVVFGGKEIVNGNESLPYFPLDEHVDPYGQSKSVAEQLVLKSNGRPSRNNSGVRLYTCAIRPAAIYGPGEERHLPRILSLAKMGLLSFNVGDSSIKTDWVYVDNLVLSLIMASMGLLDDIPGRKHPIAAGQAYFICDGAPVNTFDFIISPLLQKLDYDLPKITLDVKHALFMSRIIAFIYTLLYPWLNCRWLPGPLLLPAEVYKIGVTHYFSYLKAREELGYIPMVSPSDGLSKTISYWQERKRREIEGPTIFTTFLVLFGMFALFCAAFLPPLGPVKWVYNLSMFMFRSLWMTRLAFVAAVACHVGEGIYAWYLARRVDPQNALGWFWQTFALGFFSLRFLLKRAKSN
ncbi:short-chain dehydrogenase/reductase family 42E member 1 [Asparagus officinalis]|uniref:short-chain dehydrogenase/reductase family 42E member 1 n=1 Tax=Asparagus officinalis TaxID=4686 RepID=UPI00098E2397|nr:short-chain dehydrogenase/reductase family 42E member 1 [Asparagus officinalis]